MNESMYHENHQTQATSPTSPSLNYCRDIPSNDPEGWGQQVSGATDAISRGEKKERVKNAIRSVYAGAELFSITSI
jgi:hypothetical protein